MWDAQKYYKMWEYKKWINCVTKSVLKMIWAQIQFFVSRFLRKKVCKGGGEGNEMSFKWKLFQSSENTFL